MATLGRIIMDTAKLALTALSGANDPGPSSTFQSPSPYDVLEVKNLLKKSALPLEIIDLIVDYAEYWPCTTVSTASEIFVVGGQGSSGENSFVLRTLPLGYFPESTESGPPALPLDSYIIKENVAHKIEPSDAVQAMTLDLLKQWKSRSIPRGNHPCRKVVFTIKSKDQGWADRREFRGTYQGSYSWFDVGLEQIKAIDKSLCTPEIQIPQGFREQFHLGSAVGSLNSATSIYCDLHTIKPNVLEESEKEERHMYDRPSEPTGDRLQSNRTGIREVKEHIITWAYNDCIEPSSIEGDKLEELGRGRLTGNGNFVRNLKVGNIITIWARARFPGWRNEVKEVKIDVYWAV